MAVAHIRRGYGDSLRDCTREPEAACGPDGREREADKVTASSGPRGLSMLAAWTHKEGASAGWLG
jgi:hypothetical protein